MITWFKSWFYIKILFFGALKLSKIADPDKYSNSGYGIGFNSQLPFLTSIFDFGKNVIVYGVDNSSSTYPDNKKNILVLDESQTHGLDCTTATTESKCSVNFTASKTKFWLKLCYNGGNSFLYVNGVKRLQY